MKFEYALRSGSFLSDLAFYVRRASFQMPVVSPLNTVNLSAPLNRVYWIRKEDPMHRPHKVSTKILGLGVFMVGVVLLTIGLILGLEFPVYVTEKIERDQCILDKDHMFYDQWSTDEQWTRLNRLYYWQLENPEEFRQGGTPRFVERGPYIYREERQYVNVEFTGTRMSYQTKLKQTFAADLTRIKCGNTCMETDQLTVVNTEVIQRLYENGGWDSYIFKQIPNYIQTKIRRLGVLVDDGALYEYLGCVDENCDNQTLAGAQQEICDNHTVSFGTFLQQNPGVRTYSVMLHFNNSVTLSAKVLLMKSVYQHLITSKFDLSDKREHCDTGSSNIMYDFYWVVEVAERYNDTLQYSLNNNTVESQTYLRINLTPACSIFSVTQTLTTHLLTFSSSPANWSFFVCNEGTDTPCQGIVGDFETILSYFMVISDFVDHLVKNVADLYKSLQSSQIYHTVSQKSLALGYSEGILVCDKIFKSVVKGILTSHSRLDEVFFTSPKISVSTCLEQGNTDNNMIVRKYNGSQFAPPGVYTEASVPHFGYTLYIPPSDHCRTCSKPYPNNKTYSVFNEDLYRSIVFEEKQEVDVHGYRLFRFELSDSTFVPNQPCKLINTTSVLSYPSLVGVPYYQGSECNYLRNFVRGTSLDRISYLEVEPWTGRIWRQSTKLQTSTIVDSDLTARVIQSPFDHLNYIGVPLPVYWVEKSAEISQDAVDYFGHKIVRLMSVSCGGLIGLTVVAMVTMGLSFFVGLLSTRKNRVEPMAEAGRTNGFIHR